MPEERTYENATPIADESEALVLLLPERHTLKKIHARNGQQPYIEDSLYNSGYTREEYTSSEYWLLAPELVEQLLRMGHVTGTPYLGYTDRTELRLTEDGEKTGWRLRRERVDILRAEIKERLEKSPLSADICLEINMHLSCSSLRYLIKAKRELDTIDLTADADAYKDFLPYNISRT